MTVTNSTYMACLMSRFPPFGCKLESSLGNGLNSELTYSDVKNAKVLSATYEEYRYYMQVAELFRSWGIETLDLNAKLLYYAFLIQIANSEWFTINWSNELVNFDLLLNIFELYKSCDDDAEIIIGFKRILIKVLCKKYLAAMRLKG